MNAKWQFFPQLVEEILKPTLIAFAASNFLIPFWTPIIINLLDLSEWIMNIGLGGICLMFILTEWSTWSVILLVVWIEKEPTYLNEYFRFEDFIFKYPVWLLGPAVLASLGLIILM